MNIAYGLCSIDDYEKCSMVVQLGLSSGVVRDEIERVGLAMVLMGRCAFMLGASW
jgi:hypothetical protein